MLTWLALSVHSGHFQAGRESMAREGATKEKVPPWRMGSLKEGEKCGYRQDPPKLAFAKPQRAL